MKNSLLIVLLCLISPSLCLAQQNPYELYLPLDWDDTRTLDSAYVRVEYEMTFRDAIPYYTKDKAYVDTFDFPEDRYITDRRIVEIGKTVRKDYSLVMESWEQLCKKLKDEGKDPVGSDKVANRFELFVYEDGKTVLTQRTLMFGPVLLLEEDEPVFVWALTGDTSTVMGYECNGASVSFAGRDYKAWFCPDLPIDAGPYKFSGLPGLILKVEDMSGSYLWEAVGIEQGSWPIYEKQILFEKCSRDKFHKTIEGMFAHPYAFMNAIGVRLRMEDGKGNAREPGEFESSISLYYDPIELK